MTQRQLSLEMIHRNWSLLGIS